MWDVTGVSICMVGTPEFLLTHPVWDVTARELYLTESLLKFLLTHPVWDVTKTCGW